MTQQPTGELVEELCLALRDVGVRTRSLPDDKSAISAIQSVQQIYTLLKSRNADVQVRIERLSQETTWQMEILLRECLAFPDIIPYVRDSDGIRRALRCGICQTHERPDREGIWLCDPCLSQAKEAIDGRVPMKGLLLLRTYNQECWCKHANGETVLVAFDDYEPLESTYCKECILDEQSRREALRD